MAPPPTSLTFTWTHLRSPSLSLPLVPSTTPNRFSSIFYIINFFSLIYMFSETKHFFFKNNFLGLNWFDVYYNFFFWVLIKLECSSRHGGKRKVDNSVHGLFSSMVGKSLGPTAGLSRRRCQNCNICVRFDKMLCGFDKMSVRCCKMCVVL